MFEDKGFPTSVPSFGRPVTPVLVDPQDAPLLHFSLNAAWLPVLRGALFQLCLPATWDTATDADQQLILGRAQDLLALFDDSGVAMEDVRQNTESPCILEKTLDDGATWIPWANTALCAPLVRVRPKIVGGVTGEITQTSTDGGATWQDVPGSFYDPKIDGVFTPPWTTPPDGMDGKCLAAANIASVLQTVINVTDTNITDGLGFLALLGALSGVLTVIFPPILAADGLIALAETVGGISKAIFESQLTADAVEKFRCIVFKHDTFDGTITPFQFGEIQADVESQFGGTLAGNYILNWMNALGPVGLSMASNGAGITSADCSDCEDVCEAFYDFKTGLHGWTVDVDTPGILGPGYNGIYVSGVGVEPLWHDYGFAKRTALGMQSPTFSARTITTTTLHVIDIKGNGTGDRFAFNLYVWYRLAGGSISGPYDIHENTASWWAGEVATGGSDAGHNVDNVVQVIIGGYLNTDNYDFYGQAWAITDATIHCL